MGRALALGWLKAGLDAKALYVVDPALGEGRPSDILPGALSGLPTGNIASNTSALPVGLTPRAIVLAVKPQIIDDIVSSFSAFLTGDQLFISVAAGITLARLQAGAGKNSALVRAMPNMPAAIGAGITGMVAGAGVSSSQKQLADDLLTAIGETVWIDSETLMDAVTAVSGSGPAYLFHLVESMAAAGADQGLSEDVAMQLARQTVIGAAQMLATEDELSAAELRGRVTSPGGTTAAALDVLAGADKGMTTLLKNAIEAATMRGAELAK